MTAAPREGRERTQDAALLWLVATTMAPYWRPLALALLLLMGMAVLGVAPPYLLQRAIDGPIARGDPAGLWGLAGLYAGAVLLTFALQFGQTYFLQLSGQRALADLRRRLFDHMQRQSMDFHGKHGVGELIQRLTGDIDALNALLSSSVVTILTESITLVTVVIVMFSVNWRMAFLALAVLPLLAVATRFFRRRVRRSSESERSMISRVSSFLNEQINGMLLVQLFRREQVSATEFEVLNRRYRAALMALRKQSAIFLAVLELLSALALASLLYWGGRGVLAGWATLGTLVAFVQYSERAFQPILRLSEQYNNVQIALASAERVERMLVAQPTVQEPAQPVPLGTITGAVELRDVHFSYVPDEPVLHGVSLRIEPGQNVAVVGPTGAGKSSLAGLLARFYDPQQGAVMLDGKDIRQLRLGELRRAVAVVPQDPICIAGTIRSNIRLYDTTISDEDVRHAAELANAASFIEQLPEGYDTAVRPGGANLSLGQRQLLSLARAIALSPAGVLVLDEATSSIDTATEALIQEALERLLRSRTSVVIAHRLTTIRKADRIIVMERGRIVEDGPHDELLRLDGHYARLYRHQMQSSTVHPPTA
jgi:ATP-binding cassette subfamily B protein